MFIAWWTGKGFFTLLLIVGSAVIFEMLRAILRLPEGIWVLGVALVAAATANWIVGRRMNAGSLAKVRTSGVRRRLLYRARHKFMSMPMETFSMLLLAGALITFAIQIRG